MPTIELSTHNRIFNIPEKSIRVQTVYSTTQPMHFELLVIKTQFPPGAKSEYTWNGNQFSLVNGVYMFEAEWFDIIACALHESLLFELKYSGQNWPEISVTIDYL